MNIVDAHLDLAFNVARGRDVTRPASTQPAIGDEIATVGLPDLRAGNVGLICATVFTDPNPANVAGYKDADGANAAAWKQVNWYHEQEQKGAMRRVSRREDPALAANAPIEAGFDPKTDMGGVAPQNYILLMEGGDPLRNTDDVKQFVDAGMRIVGLAWKKTRHAGGTGEPGPLSSEGVEMVKTLDTFGVIHDASHLAELSFWQLLDTTAGPVMASHSNCRAIVPTDRQLSDDMIKAIAKRGGVIGINFFDRFLLRPEVYKAKRRATLGDLLAHVNHICQLTGSVNHVAIGTDLDGGLGRDQIPRNITTAADLPRVGEALSRDGFDDKDVAKVMGENWRRYFRENLASQI